jgi:hypothetical protein
MCGSNLIPMRAHKESVNPEEGGHRKTVSSDLFYFHSLYHCHSFLHNIQKELYSRTLPNIQCTNSIKNFVTPRFLNLGLEHIIKNSFQIARHK